MLALIIISTIVISLIAFIGAFTLMLKEKILNKILLVLVALAAGALMGGAFLHLIPEAVQMSAANDIYLYVLVGFILFFLVEKIFHWHHCHEGKCKIHTFAYMNLFGEAVHNFIDGLIMAASFAVNIQFGLVTTLAIALHEIPQEIGDFGVLVYGGYNKTKALLLNFLVALTVVLGGIIGYFVSSAMADSINFIVPFAAGGFIYIAAADLIPEIRKEISVKKSLAIFIMFLIGIIIMLAVKALM